MPQIRKFQSRQCVNVAFRYTKMYQEVVAGQINGQHARSAGIQVAKSRVGAGRKISSADEGKTLAVTHFRTYQLLTQQLVVTPRTLKHSVTYMVSMETHLGATTTVVAGTCVAITCCLILMVRTIIHAVAAETDW